jgi:hypothetical protein
MTIEQTQTVDMIADDAVENIASLIISDHLEWDESQPDHLILLQEKINSYLRFFESGEIFENRDHLRRRKVAFKVIGLYPLSEQARGFYETASKILAEIGVTLQFELDAHALD